MVESCWKSMNYQSRASIQQARPQRDRMLDSGLWGFYTWGLYNLPRPLRCQETLTPWNPQDRSEP